MPRQALPARSLSGASSLHSLLRAAAAEAEALRRLPEAVHRAILEAGHYRVYVPQRYQGRQASYWRGAQIAFELAEACPAAGWVASVIASHAWVQGMMSIEAQDEVWKDNPRAVIASGSWGPQSGAEAVEGGFLLDGTWRFASGVDYADWAHFNLFLPSGHRFALVPRRDFTILDDWHATGLRGTGSNSLVVKKVFVPLYRTLDSHACKGAPTAGSKVHGDLLYRLPLYGLFGMGLAAPAVGAARGAWREMLASGGRLAERPTAQLRLAEAGAEIDSAQALLRATCDEAETLAREERLPGDEERFRWRRNTAYAAQLCVRAVERLYPLGGATGLDEQSVFQRHFRDVHAIAAHIALSWDVQATSYGTVALGGGAPDPKI